MKSQLYLSATNAPVRLYLNPITHHIYLVTLMKTCPDCGQPIYDCKELEKRLGTPLIFLFEQYSEWKKLQVNSEKDGVLL